MKINSVRIRDFRGISKEEIENFHPSLNLFIGVNGAGKSSILDAISQLLSGFTSRILSASGITSPIAPKDVKNDSEDGCRISVDVDENSTHWEFYRSNKLEKTGKSDTEELNTLAKGYRHKIDENRQACLPVIVHYGVKRSVTDIPLKISRDGQTNPTEAYIDAMDSAASFRSFFQWYRNEEDYENEQLRDDPEFECRGLNAIRTALSMVLPEYTDLRVRRKPTQGLYMKKNGVEYRLEQFSDGEKCYIALVCDIVRRLMLANPVGDVLNGNGIVLIDEVDLHLHPQWEATIMTRLHEAFPNIQFIVSAHSPLVASNFEGNVYAVSDGHYRELPKIFGLDYSTILQDFMGTYPGNKKLKVLVDMYKAYFENDMFDAAESTKSKIMEMVKGDWNIPYLQKAGIR